MSTLNFVEYNPPAPTPGLTVINIHFVGETCAGTYLYYDIGIGPSAGYAFIQYQMTGEWPLIWWISNSPNATIVYNRAFEAAQDIDPSIRTLEDARNIPIWVELGYDAGGHIRVCRSYPWNQFLISPDDIRIDTNSWAKGSSNFVRASLIAKNSGLSVLLADVHGKDSPMVEWCAENRIAIQPMSFPFGDYASPLFNTVVDRKENLLELYENFIVPDKRPAYERDAVLVEPHAKSLVYVIATKPEDHVAKLEDLKNWSVQIPGKQAIANGEKLYIHLVKYRRLFTNVDFCFCDGLYVYCPQEQEKPRPGSIKTGGHSHKKRKDPER